MMCCVYRCYGKHVTGTYDAPSAPSTSMMPLAPLPQSDAQKQPSGRVLWFEGATGGTEGAWGRFGRTLELKDMYDRMEASGLGRD